MIEFVQAATAPANPWIDSATLAILVAVIALFGVLVAQTITLINERAKRRDELTKAVRDEVQQLMMAFYDWVEFARHTYPGKRVDTQCEPFEERWATASPSLPATAARMAGRGRHRTVVLTLIDGITIQSTAYREGESVGGTPKLDTYRWGGLRSKLSRHGYEASVCRATHDAQRVRRSGCEIVSTRSTCGARGRWTRTTSPGSSVWRSVSHGGGCEPDTGRLLSRFGQDGTFSSRHSSQRACRPARQVGAPWMDNSLRAGAPPPWTFRPAIRRTGANSTDISERSLH